MPGQPTPQDLHVDALLTMLSIAYMNEPSVYIADQAFPVVTVGKQSNKIAKYDKEYWFRNEAKLRAPATESHGGGYEVDTSDTYFCENWSFHVDVAIEDRENYDSPFDPDNDATMLVVEKFRLVREAKFAADFFKTTVWATDNSTATKWSDYGSSAPIQDVEAAREVIFSSTAKDPNKLVLGRAVWAQIKHHPDFIERIKYTQKAILTVDIVASLLEVDQILVGKAIASTTNEGIATQTVGYIFGKNALLLYTPARPGLRIPSAGYTFHWNKLGSLSFVRRINDAKTQADRIEGHTYFDQKAIATDCGYFFSAIVA